MSPKNKFYLSDVNSRIERPSNIHDNVNGENRDVTGMAVDLDLDAADPEDEVVEAGAGVQEEVEVDARRVVESKRVEIDAFLTLVWAISVYDFVVLTSRKPLKDANFLFV